LADKVGREALEGRLRKGGSGKGGCRREGIERESKGGFEREVMGKEA